MSSFSDILKKIMKEKNISQADLAKTSGIAQSSISDYLNDRYQPKKDKILALANALSCSPSLLLGVEPKKKTSIPEKSEEIIKTIKIMSTVNHYGQLQILSYAEQISELPKYQKDNITYVDKDGLLKVVSKNNDEQPLPYVASSSWKDDHSNDEELADWINKMKEDEIDNQ